MANVKKGQLTAPPEWWKHLRWTKRSFWKAERKAGKEEAARQTKTTRDADPDYAADNPSSLLRHQSSR